MPKLSDQIHNSATHKPGSDPSCPVCHPELGMRSTNMAKSLQKAAQHKATPVQGTDLHRTACNHAEGTSAIAKGAKAYVLDTNAGNGFTRMKILVRSRSGRWIEKWEAINSLKNFRPVTIPPASPLHSPLVDGCESERLLFLTEGTK